ncbi:uncharacterized protein KQ657_004152 [Scheffersomyces spartinae]|uniref:MICOS complex subunit n=1 Tax=Scheffersomyces spartinae TaxID=45513 RepID=A0A9P7VCZ2_9ASCO|nr:uncharacterized protein KQ657_004152 [Scheffersomyces spartinae]KAG7195039.1 hypothetical protein KQ657_004152 [Scheffersomyces spartinae]
MGKRSFYEDDSDVISIPGLATAIPEDLKAKEGAHGEVSFVDGMTVRTSPYLEKYANEVRYYVHDKYTIIAAELATQRLALRQEWNSVTSFLNNDLIKDPLLPNSIYILTITLLGSIAARNRGLPLRFLTPAVFGTGAVAYYAPNTFNATKSHLCQLERENLPELYQQQQQLKSQWDALKDKGDRLSAQLEAELQNSVHQTRAFIKDLFK